MLSILFVSDFENTLYYMVFPIHWNNMIKIYKAINVNFERVVA